MSNTLHIKPRADVDDIIAAMQYSCPWRIPLVRAVATGIIAVSEPARDAAAPCGFLDSTRRPSVLLIGDDDGLDTGPAGWRATRRAVRWARGVLVHAAGGTAEHYAVAVAEAVRVGKLLLIETGTARLDEWLAVLDGATRRIGIGVIAPPPSGMHPVPPGRMGLQ